MEDNKGLRIKTELEFIYHRVSRQMKEGAPMNRLSGQTRYIPFRKRDIVEMILKEGGFHSDQERSDFERVCEITESIFHYEFHRLLEKLKNAYYPINPDLNKSNSATDETIDRANQELITTMQQVLNDANYDKIPQEEIEQAFQDSALIGFSVKIDFDSYEFIEIYGRGRRRDRFTVPRLLGLKKVEMEHEILERVLLLARIKPVEGPKKNGKEDLVHDSGSTIIKLFKDVTMEDLEILLPNSKVTMSLKDKLMLAIPAIAGGVPLLVTKVVPALIVAFIIISTYFGVSGTVEENQLKQAVAVFSALGALGGFIFKQWSKYKTKKFQFQKELSDNLYFRNLVNNAGVFYSLIDSAEEEECKEAFLAYYFLLTSKTELTEQELDEKVELWMKETHGCVIDFECPDALAKLKRLEILETGENQKLKVTGLKETLQILDRRWDNIFQY